ncbi:MAG TPA: hypothetical protein VF619_05385 [Allosphingosinicella sp.]|jgi:uncharacterized phiE125 gp8 family phage protein
MIESEGLVLPPEAVGAAKEFLRVERPDEDGLIGALAGSAAELCESFIGEALLERGFTETIPASRAWRRLSRGPVRAITLVEALAADGAALALPVEAYAVDLDCGGGGWVRLSGPGAAGRIRVGFRAGLASAWADLPEALRHGIVRLAAHFYTNRTAEGPRGTAEPPAAVAALWRPYRRLRLR